MATGTKICKFCGKEYPACKTVFKPGVFRWRDVACSPEHAAKYLEQLTAARTEQSNDVADAKQSQGDSAAPIKLMADGGGVTHAADDTPAAEIPRKKRKRKAVEAEDPVE